MKPLVSILIPVFNSQRCIADTLKSALGQSWERKEIIVVDDGSTDGTLEVIKQFESTFLKVVQQKNQGAAAARNRAFSLCQGDYVQWLDADDLLARDKIARQLDSLAEPVDKSILLSGGWGRFIHRYYRATFIPSDLWHDQLPVDWLIRKMGQNLYMQTASWLVSRELTEAAGPWDTTLSVDDDGEYFCRVLLASDGIRFVPEARVYYRASGASSLSYIGRSSEKRDAQWRSMKMHIDYIRSLEDSERVKRACVSYLQNGLIEFYTERMDLVEQAELMALSLGGKLVPPRLSWKYSWIASSLGWPVAKHAQLVLPSLMWFLQGFWDKTLLRVENIGQAGSLRI